MNVFTTFRNSVQIQYQQAHVIIIVNRNSDIIDMQFRYHRYAIQISSICSSSPEFPMLSIIHSLSISTSRKLIKVELDYTSVKLYLIILLSNYTSHFSCYKVHTLATTLSIGWEEGLCSENIILGLILMSH